MYSSHAGLTVVYPPSLEAFDLEDMKLHIKDVPDEDDELVAGLIGSAREWIESFTGRTLFDTTLELTLDAYPSGWIELRRPPIIEIVSFKYTDSDAVSQTIAADQYTLDSSNILSPIVMPAYSVTWPSTRSQPSSLRVRYRAGYARAGSPDERSLIPSSLKSAMKLIVGHLYEHRETVTEGQPLHEVPMGAEWLCRPYRVGVGLG